MTTTTASTDLPDRPVSAPLVLRRAMAAEWVRLWSVRSTWWCLLAGAAIMVLMGGAVGADFAGDPTPVWWAGEFAIVPGQLAFHLIVVLAVTSEYSTGMIRSSLQWVPRRGVLLTARTIVTVGVATVAAVLVGIATNALAWAFLGPDAEVVAGDVVRSLAVIALMAATGGLVAVGLGTLLRSTAGALSGVFLLVLGLPVLLPSFGVTWLTWAAERLPGYATAALLDAMGIPPLPTSTTVTVLATWIVGTLAAGAWAVGRRDA